MPGGGQRRAGLGQLLREARLAVAADRLADLGQRPPGRRLDVAHLRRGPRRVALGQPARQLALQRDQRQGVAEQVVQVAGEAQPLLGDGEAGELVPGLHQFGVHGHEVPRPAEGEGGEQAQQRQDEQVAEQTVGGDHARADGSRGQDRRPYPALRQLLAAAADT